MAYEYLFFVCQIKTEGCDVCNKITAICERGKAKRKLLSHILVTNILITKIRVKSKNLIKYTGCTTTLKTYIQYTHIVRNFTFQSFDAAKWCLIFRLIICVNYFKTAITLSLKIFRCSLANTALCAPRNL